jgi:WD40 repeat protein
MPYPWCIAFSRDGRALVSGGEDGQLHVWEVATGKEARRFQAHGRPVSCLSLSPDGKWLASSAPPYREVLMWDLATGTEVRRFEGHTHDVTCLAFSPDSKWLASGCKGHTVRVWEVATGRQLHWLGNRKAVKLAGPAFLTVAFSPDGKYLAGGDTEYRVHLWSASTGKLQRTLKGHTDDVVGIAFTPDSKRLVSGSLDRTVRLWEVADGKQFRRYGSEDDPVCSVALSVDGKMIAAGTAAGLVHAWDTASGKLLWQGEESFLATALAFSPGGETLATATRYGIGLWGARTGKRLHPSIGPSTGATQLAYSPDGRLLAVAYRGRGVWLWDTQKWQERARGKKPRQEILSLRFESKQQLLALARTEGGIEWWDVAAGQAVGRLAAGKVAVVAPDGHVVASTAQGLVRWGPAGRAVRGPLVSNEVPVHCAAVSVEGTVAVATWEGAFLLDSKAARLLGKSGEGRGVAGFLAFSPDGASLLVQRANDLCLWEVATGRRRLLLKGRTVSLTAAAFSPEGRLVVLLDRFGDARLWDLSTGQVMGQITGHRARVNALAFSPDGKRLATGGEDTTVLVWEVGRLVPASRVPAATLTDRELERLWQDLGGRDAEKAYRAIWALVGQPGRVGPFLKRKLGAPGATPARVRRLIAELDSDEFTTREKASRELQRLGQLVRPALRHALDRRPSLEATSRIEGLLRKLQGDDLGPAEVRISRALEVLARVDTPQARRLLEEFTGGGQK